MNPKIIGICGGSCSGKSTLARQILSSLGPERSVLLPQDDYFHGLDDAPNGKNGPNFDHPDAVDFAKLCKQLAMLKQGLTVDRPLYDFAAHCPKVETQRTVPKPFILVDGILILHHAPLRAQLDFSIFVECNSKTRFSRRLDRDIKERGRTAKSVRQTFADQVDPMHDKFVEPSKKHADLIVDSQQSERSFNRQLASILQEINIDVQ